MVRAASLVLSGVLAAAMLVLPGQNDVPQDQDDQAVTADNDMMRWLLEEIDRLNAEAESLRRELAQEELARASAERDADELRQFIRDHREFGNDFAEYARVRAAAEAEARRQAQEAGRVKREADRAARTARRAELRAAREEEQGVERYRRAGFAALGLDVFTSRIGYAYATTDEANQTGFEYDPFLGFYYRPGVAMTQIDYSRMTISGSVLNAGPDVRNIGIAITLFDESGNQVGSEIIQIANARPDVPYPFTSTLEMALDRPFSSASTYVLYADPAPAE